MGRLKVLACAFTCAPGGGSGRFWGGETVLGWNVIRQLGRFHEVWVLTHSQNREAIEEFLQSSPSPSLHFCYFALPGWLERLKDFQGGIQLYAYLWQARAYGVARRLHRQVQFEAFHHVTYANDWMASFIGALLPVPYIRGPGGGAHRTPKSFLSEYSSQARAWERFRSFGQWVLRHDPFFLAGRRRARALLACNREAFEAIPDRLQHKVHLFPVNGISSDDLSILEEDAPSQQSRLDAPFQVFSAGKLLGLKGYGLAIRGFGRFAEGHPNAQFTIVGDGPEFPRLEVLVRHLGLGKQVRFERWMVREQLLARMRSCDVLLFPSLRDGGGAVVVEAMAAGKPVICLDLAGPGMHVTPECGIKIAPESPDQAVSHIAKALDRLCQDGDLRLQMGRNARQRAEQAYHWDRLGERLFEIYGQAVKS